MRCPLPVAFVGLMALPAAAEVPLVVTDIPPVHSLVAQVMGDLGAPEVLVDQGADAHSFQLRPSQAQSLSEAKLIIWMGPEMTPWLDRTLDGLGPDARQLRLLAVPDVMLLEFGAHEEHG
ncbi:MAG: metal ABC transporter solute-binding protein, Zn/Mn family, partial [Paracoccaceae bacterium]